MSRFPMACLVVALALCAGGLPAQAADGFAPVQRVSKGESFASLGGRHRGSFHPTGWGRGPGHRWGGGFGRRWGGFVPAYLDYGYRDQGPVIIQQTIAPVTVIGAPAAVPSFATLPVSAGIRETRPAEPAVYVLNEQSPQRLSAARGGARSAGPRIISLVDQEDEAWASEPASGARIIHLTVPVASR